jgi:hypothetical protein
MSDRNKRTPGDQQRDEFDRKYRDWHATRAAAYDPDLSEDDKSATARFDAYYAAQAALMTAPAPLPYTVFQKWELLDHLMTDERIRTHRGSVAHECTVAHKCADNTSEAGKWF